MTPRYAGIRWLGITWGRAGRPAPAIFVSALAFGWSVLQVVLLLLAEDSGGATLGVLDVALLVATTSVGSVFAVDAWFARRVRDEQEPLGE